MHKRIKSRFTLVELLVATGLMVMMVSLALPAFSRMMGNNKVDVMASNIKTAIEQGQSTAVGRNCYIAVVFPLTSTKAKNYNFGGYGIVEVKPSEPDKDGENVTSSSYKFSRWVSESFTNRPDGALLISDGSSKDDTVKAEAMEGNFTELKALAGTTGSSNSENSLAGCKAVIFKPTGECVNNSMYIYIAAADTSSLKVPNTSDFRCLYLNQFTGRVEYVTDDWQAPNGGN